MADSILYLIRWDSFSSKPYLYGSSLRHLPDGTVRFMNGMMPSGYPIKDWTSFTNFQRDRHEPQLPLLEAGRAYRFRAWYFDQPSGTIFVRFDFYDQQGNRVEYQIFDEKEGTFTVPQKTFRYTMQLVQGGSEKLMFYYVELFAENEKIFREVQNPDVDSKVLNLMIPELKGRMAFVPDGLLSERYPDDQERSAEIGSDGLTQSSGVPSDERMQSPEIFSSERSESSGTLPNVLALSPWMDRLPLKMQIHEMERITAGYSRVCFWGKGKNARRLAEALSRRIQDDAIEKRICCDEQADRLSETGKPDDVIEKRICWDE